MASTTTSEIIEWKLIQPGLLGLGDTAFKVKHELGLIKPFIPIFKEEAIGLTSYATLVEAKDVASQYRRDLREIGLLTE